jgi:integrase/recombinase XerD
MSFTDFLKEKQYLQNVSPNTLRWYKFALKWLPNEQPDERALKTMVIRMREQGLKATGCNAAIRAINCYLRWSGSPHHIQPLREPQLVLPTFTAEQVRLLIKFKPKTDFERRLHLLVLILLDTGARISEVLGLQWNDVDLDNMLLTLHGKGQKDRKIPISFELRKALHGYRTRHQDSSKTISKADYGSVAVPGQLGVSMSAAKVSERRARSCRTVETPDSPLPTRLIFDTSARTPWGRIGALRSVKLHCQKLGFEPPVRTLHAFRHSFSISYLRHGGSVFHLQKQLGHSSLEMTRRYANLQTHDLSAVHSRLSLLSAGM